MSKAEFLKKARNKMKSHNEPVTNGVDWIGEMSFLYDEQTMLRVFWDNELNEYCHRWSILNNIN